MARKPHIDDPMNAHLARLLERIGEVSRAMRWEEATGSGLSPLQLRILGFVADHAGQSVGVGPSLYFNDPDGNSLELKGPSQRVDG